MKKKTKQEVAQDLINGMFIIAGHDVTYDDVIKEPDGYYNRYTWTPEQEKEWITWATEYVKKHMKYRTTYADREISMFNLAYGLRTIHPVTETDNA